MSSNVFQLSNQATAQQQQCDYIAKHLLVDGKAPDEAMLTRIVNAKPKPAPKGNLQTRGFSLLR